MILLLPGQAAGRSSLNSFEDHGLEKEGAAVERFALSRLANTHDLRKMIREKRLARVPNRGKGFVLDQRLGLRDHRNRQLYRHARPYTLRFIQWLGREYGRRFDHAFRITSLVRTCEYQRRLRRSNPNATSCEATSHTTGATVDIQYRVMSRRGRTWVRSVLLDFERQGFLQATMERGQPVFHVMVYPTYGQSKPTRERPTRRTVLARNKNRRR
ncbi:hypothetical protein HY628_01465 [Candidatus Uhrbacteria bacterium]|nr:hypothetical protein [Candidatus Uhrbacteria bacterium]